MAKNIYSDIIPKSLFEEYKNSDILIQIFIEEKVIEMIREINEFPYPILTFEQEVQSLRSLATIDTSTLYDNDRLGTYSVGVDVLYKYYPNIFKVEKSVMPISVYDGFYTEKRLRRAVKKCLTYENNFDSIVRWLKMTGCGYCNNFRPAAAKAIYEMNGGKDIKVYDYAAGYGGRLLGAWAAENVREYVAVDPNTETYGNAVRFIEYLDRVHASDFKAEINCMGSEEFCPEKYKGYFDLAFSSPQYFDTEIYTREDTQSCFKFNDYDSWVRGFLRPTIHNAMDMLKPDGIFAINIFDKIHEIKRILQFICGERGYNLYKVDRYLMPTMPGYDGDKPRDFSVDSNSEPIFYFRRG